MFNMLISKETKQHHFAAPQMCYSPLWMCIVQCPLKRHPKWISKIPSLQYYHAFVLVCYSSMHQPLVKAKTNSISLLFKCISCCAVSIIEATLSLKDSTSQQNPSPESSRISSIMRFSLLIVIVFNPCFILWLTVSNTLIISIDCSTYPTLDIYASTIERQ